MERETDSFDAVLASVTTEAVHAIMVAYHQLARWRAEALAEKARADEWEKECAEFREMYLRDMYRADEAEEQLAAAKARVTELERERDEARATPGRIRAELREWAEAYWRSPECLGHRGVSEDAFDVCTQCPYVEVCRTQCCVCCGCAPEGEP